MSYVVKKAMCKEDYIKMANDRKAESERIKAIIISKKERLRIVSYFSESYSKIGKDLKVLNEMYIEAISDANRLIEYAESIKE